MLIKYQVEDYSSIVVAVVMSILVLLYIVLITDHPWNPSKMNMGEMNSRHKGNQRKAKIGKVQSQMDDSW